MFQSDRQFRRRLVGYSFVGVALVLLLVVAGSAIFGDGSGMPDEYARGRLQNYPLSEDPFGDAEAKPALIEPGDSFLSIKSDTYLDPMKEKTFVLSFLLRFTSLPEIGKRQKLVVKYAAQQPPYPGWAMALKRNESLIRPEVYWQGENGKGGWYSFDAVDFRPGLWYAVSLIARTGESISVFVEPVEDFAKEPGDAAVVHSSGVDEETLAGVGFAGGYDVSEVEASPTLGKLYVQSKGGSNGFRGQVAHVLIGQTDMVLDSREGAREFLAGGSLALARRLSEKDIVLWIDESGTDRSRFAREIPSARNKL